MVGLPYPSPRRSAGGSSAGPKFVRPVPRRLKIDLENNRDYLVITSSTSISKADLIAQAHAVEPSLPGSALAWERFLIGSGGAGYSGAGFGGLPGSTARDVIPFDAIPDDAVFEIEIGAPGIGQANGQGTMSGSSAIYPLNVAPLQVVGGLPGEAAQADQRALHVWASQNGIEISDLGQNLWPGSIFPSGPSSSSGPGAGAPNVLADTNIPYVSGGYGSRSFDRMYRCGDGGGASPTGIGEDAPGVGGGGGAGDPAYPGGSGHVGELRYAIIVMETING